MIRNPSIVTLQHQNRELPKISLQYGEDTDLLITEYVEGTKSDKAIEIYNFSEGLACVKKPNGLYGYINKLGEEVIPCIYTSTDDFSEGLAGVVDQDNNLFYIDKQGTKVLEIPKIYNSVLISRT